MTQARLCTLVLVVTSLIGLHASLTPSQPARAAWLPAGQSTHGPITDREIVRNGDFDQDKTGWNVVGISSGVQNVGQDGGPALVMEGITENQVSAYQEIYLPTQTTAATFSFDYRLLYPDFPNPGQSTGFYASISTYSSVITNVLAIPFSGDTGWQQLQVSLTPNDVTNLQAAHDAGEPVYVFFMLYQEPANVFKAYLDDVSFQVSGNADVPDLNGSIAYVGSNEAGYPTTINRVEPDGSNPQTLWTHPSPFPETNTLYDVAWKPDAAELAFSSNHESAYSAFHSDVYGLEPDGSDLRRITNPPSKAALDAGSYQMGTVTGQVYNNYGSVTTFLLYVQGAQEAISVDVGAYGDTTGFTLPNVADLGAGLHYVVSTWSDGSNANCKEYAAAVVDVQPGGTVDAGTLEFNGTCGTYDSDSISWKRDGSQVGVDVITPRAFDATGEAIGSELFSAPLTADELAWSPVNDQILYRNVLISGDRGIYLTSEGGATGTWLVNEGSGLWVTPAWLPDGSGFVYSLDHYLYQYDLSSSQVITLATFYNEYVLNPSLSPDGGYVVFERESTGTPIQRDLWILNRTNPVEMWPLTDDGRSSDPDWSRQDPQLPPDCPIPLSDVSVNGPDSGYTGTAYTFDASLTPTDATAPITYTWSPEPASGQGTSSASYTWSTSGTQTISLTARNCGGSQTDVHTITIDQASSGCPVPLSGVTIAGPTDGYVDVAYTLNASVTPADATTPVTYTWSPEPASGQGTSSASYTWHTSGTQTISLTAQNCGGSGNDSHQITITDAGYYVYLPIVQRNN